MSSKSSGTPVRRYLSFDDLPYRGQRFYLDIRKAANKNKLAQQIIYLGGTVEGFLSKDLSLIVTDRDVDKPDSCSKGGKKPVKSQIPLSRGQALLQASQDQVPKDGNNQDLLQSASNLGIKTQKASAFIRATSKILTKIKSRKKGYNESDVLEGMSPISWDKDKENMCLLKVEDDENLFRPLFKQFEMFPEVDFCQPGSPFDVGIVLTKESKENTQVKKKSAGPGVVKGGYCESCDHWYKCSLREHLKSDKHQTFVKSVDNFRSLDNLVISLPNLHKFFGKHGVEFESDCEKVTCELNRMPVAEQHPGGISNNEQCLNKEEYPTIEKSTIRSEFKQAQSSNNYTQLSEFATSNVWSSHNSGENGVQGNGGSEKILFDKMANAKCMSERNSEKAGSKTDKSVSSDRRLTLNQVLRDVFDADDDVDASVNILDEEEDKENCDPTKMQKTARGSPLKEIREHGLLDKSSNVCHNVNVVNKQGSSDQSASLNNVLHNSGFMRQAPEASFSSSCTFGDHGVGNILSYLNSNESGSTQSSLHESSEAKARASDDRASVSGHSDTSGYRRDFDTKLLSNCNVDVSNTEETSSFAPILDPSAQSRGYVSNFLSHFDHNTNAENGSTQTADSFIQSTDENRFGISTLASTVLYPSSGHSSTVNLSKCDNANKNSHFSNKNSVNSKTGSVSEQASGIYPLDDHIPNSFSDRQAKLQENVEIHTKGENIANDQTPKGKNMAFAQLTLEDLCRSGSSIRNWLVPKDDDEMSVKTVLSNLDHTLVEMENSPVPVGAKAVSSGVGGDAPNSSAKDLPKEEENGPSNLVANWIKTQAFNQNEAAGIAQHNAKTHTCDNSEEVSLGKSGLQHDTNVNIDRVDLYVNGDDANDVIKNSWTDNCSYTSVSDCTVYSDFNTKHEYSVSNLVDVKSESIMDSIDRCANRVRQSDSQSNASGYATDSKAHGLSELETHNNRTNHQSKETSITVSQNNSHVASMDTIQNQSDMRSRTFNDDTTVHTENKNSTNHTSSGAIQNNMSLIKNVGESIVQNTLPLLKQSLVKEPDNKTIKKTARKPRQTKNSEAKKKVSKAKQKSMNKAVTTQQMNAQLLPQSPTPMQNPYMNQVMYSPISMASESAPVDPCSPYAQHMWHKSAAYLSQPQTYSPSHHNSYNINSGQFPFQGSYSGVNSADIANPFSHTTQVSNLYNHNSRIDTNNKSSLLDMLSSPQKCFTTRQQQPVSLIQHSTTQSCLTSQYPANYSIGHFNNSLSSGPNLYPYPGPQPPIGHLSWEQSHAGHQNGAQHGLVPSSSFTTAVAGSPLPHTNQYHQVAPSPGIQPSNGSLSTICLSDIADDGTSHSSFSDITRYVAKPRKKSIASKSNTSANHDQRDLSSDRNPGIVPKSGSHTTVNSYNQMPQVDPNSACVTSSYQARANTQLPIQSGQVPQYVQQNTQPVNHQSQSSVYNAVQTGAMKIRLCKMPTAQGQENKSNLTHYWNVRKTGECRLVFSSNMLGKRKAEETPGKLDYLSGLPSPYQEAPDSDPHQSKRRCLVF